MAFLKLILKFITDLPKKTTEAITRYKDTLASAKGNNKNIEKAKNDLTWFFLNNYLLKVIAPLSGITLIAVLIAKYFIFILGTGFLCYLIWDHLEDGKRRKIIQQQLGDAQKNDTVYRNVTKFMLISLRELDTRLNVKMPQMMGDITSCPYSDTQNGIDRFYYQLPKTTLEPTETDQLKLTRKRLQSIIRVRLIEKQESENLRLFYNDEPCLYVESVIDIGESICIQLVHVINGESYNYVKKKSIGKPPNKTKDLPSDEDEDF